jgi:hypothetical protein
VRALSISALALLAACSTLGTASDDGQNLPTSGVGPFRKLGDSELMSSAPFVLLAPGPSPETAPATTYLEPSALAEGGDLSSTEVTLFAVLVPATGGGSSIVRTHADDARSFFGTGGDVGHSPATALVADAAWEGGSLTGPSALRVGSQTFLYYAAAGGIGVATSTDGVSFAKNPAPVLVPDPSVTWETTTPHAPSVAQYPDGQFRMLYAAGNDIGEATSADGITWTRLDSDPTTPAIDAVFGPTATVDPSTLATGELPPFDTAAVGDPCLLPRVTASGRLQVRVLYTGTALPGDGGAPASAIGFAARYGDSGPLVRNGAPVYSVSAREGAPALFEWAAGSMLYVHQTYSAVGSATYPGIAAAYSPALDTLPAPAGYPASP